MTQKKSTWNKLTDWFKNKFTKQPAAPVAKPAQTRRVATPAYKPQQAQKPVFTPPSQTKVIDATKTEIKPAEIKKIEPVKQQSSLQKLLNNTQKNVKFATDVAKNYHQAFADQSKWLVDVAKDKTKGLQKVGEGFGESLAETLMAKEIAARQARDSAQDQLIVNKAIAARKSGNEKEAQRLFGLATQDDTKRSQEAQDKADYLSQRRKETAYAAPQASLEALNLLMMGNLAGKGELLGRAGQAAGYGMARSGAGQLWDLATGKRDNLSLQDILSGGLGAASNTGLYAAADVPLNAVLGKLSGGLATKAPNAAKFLSTLTDSGFAKYSAEKGGHLLTDAGRKALVQTMGKGALKGLTEAPLESVLEPIFYREEGDYRSYGERYMENLPSVIGGNTLFGMLRGLKPGLAKTKQISDAAKAQSGDSKLYSGIPGLDMFDDEIRAYAKELEGFDLELKEAGKLDAEDMSQTELEKFLKQEQAKTVVDDTKTDLKQEAQEVLPQAKTKLAKVEAEPKQELIDGRFKTQADADRYNNRVQINKELNQFEIDPLKTYKNTELNPIQKAIGSANFIAKRSGKAGQEMYVQNQRMINFRDKEVGNANALLIPLVKGMNDYEYKNLDKIVLGEEAPQTEAGAELRDVWTNIANDIYARASNGNIKDLKGFIEGGYFPHQMKGDLLRDEFGQVMTNQRSNIGSFSKSREDGLTRDQYDTTAAALFKYIDAAYDNIAKNEFFGENNVKLYELADQATANRKQLQQIANIYGGDKRQVVSSGEKLLQNYSTTKISPLTAIRNLSQQMNVADASSWNNLRKTYAEVLKDPQTAIEYTIRANEIDSRDASTIKQDMEEGNWLGAYLKTILFAKAEKSNRIIAVNGGIKFAEDQLVKAREGNEAAVRELKRLGIDNITKDWTKEELALTAGKKMSELTQFRTEGGELPTWARSTAIGRLASKLRTFGYKQTVFRGDQAKRIGQELKNGNLRPLASALGTLGIAAPIIGEILNGAKSLILNRKRASETAIERYLNNISSIYTLGLLDDLEPLSGEYGEDAQINTIIGVNAGVMLDLFKVGAGVIKGLNQYDSEKSFIDNILPDANKRILLKGIPAIGNTLSNTLVDNAAIDNVWGGKNVGLTKDKKETYNELLDMGQDAAAQKFKDENQYLDKLDEKKKGNIFQEWFGKKDATVDTSVPTNKEEKDKIKKLMKEGAVPTEEQINATLFDGKFADSDSVKDRNDVFSSLKKAMENEDYTDEQKQAILASSGASEENLEYYTLASESSEVKLQDVIIPAISKMQSQDEIYEYLYQMRYEVGDKRVLADTMLNYLRDRGYISSDMAKALKKVQYDEIEQEFWEEESSGSGSGSGSSYAKKMAKASMQGYKDLASLLSGFANKGGIGNVNTPVNYSQYASLAQGRSLPNEVYKGKDWLSQIFSDTRQKQDGRLKTSV